MWCIYINTYTMSNIGCYNIIIYVIIFTYLTRTSSCGCIYYIRRAPVSDVPTVMRTTTTILKNCMIIKISFRSVIIYNIIWWLGCCNHSRDVIESVRTARCRFIVPGWTHNAFQTHSKYYRKWYSTLCVYKIKLYLSKK